MVINRERFREIVNEEVTRAVRLHEMDDRGDDRCVICRRDIEHDEDAREIDAGRYAHVDCWDQYNEYETEVTRGTPKLDEASVRHGRHAAPGPLWYATPEGLRSLESHGYVSGDLNADDVGDAALHIFRNARSFIDDVDEWDVTAAAESAADALGHDEWLDDSDHWVWVLAHEVGDDIIIARDIRLGRRRV